MAGKPDSCCAAPGSETGSESFCRVESVLSVDERGQMVLPKELRNRAGIGPGDRLAVVSHEKDGEICCITLMRIDSLNEMVKGVLGPIMKELTT